MGVFNLAFSNHILFFHKIYFEPSRIAGVNELKENMGGGAN